MKITGNDDVLKYFNDPTVTKPEDNGNGTENTGHVKTQAEDTVVNLSSRSKEVQLAQQSMGSEPVGRQEKVASITAKVHNGTYQIDYDKTGEKMVAAFIDEMV